MGDKWYEGTEHEQVIHFLQAISSVLDDIADSLRILSKREIEQ